jgi:tetratricopeptide (TPR) repeat protein
MSKSLTAITLILALTSALPGQQTASPGKTTAQAPARRPPQAKTRAEFSDYNSANAITGGAASEKAANDFAAKYPDSELRSILYSRAMHEYQRENNPGKMLAMGEKILTNDPDNSVALVLTATVLSDNLSDADLDRQQKIAEIRKNANRALETVDAYFTPPAGTAPEQIEAYKKMLRSMAHSALGITDLKLGDNAGAEKELQAAADLGKVQPDPYIWYHLALSQDRQNKYAEALATAEQAVQLSQPGSDLARLAAGERDRLQKLTGTAPPAQQTPANNSQPPR